MEAQVWRMEKKPIWALRCWGSAAMVCKVAAEDEVVIVDGQQFVFPLLDPLSAGQILALGAVAVAAGVETDALMMTVATAFDVSAQGGG